MEALRYKVAGATLVALLLTLVLAAGASAVPANEIVIPAGYTATLSNAAFGDNTINPGNCPADRLEYGYNLNGGADVQLASGVGCDPVAGATVGPFATPTTLRVYLEDFTCPGDYVFYSDGSHGLVTPTGAETWQVSIMDSDLCTMDPTVPRAPGAPGTGNFNVDVTLTPVTPYGVCATTTALVTGSAAYADAPLVARGSANALTAVACSAIDQVTGSPSVRNTLQIAQYERSIAGLVHGGWLTTAQGAALDAEASAL